MSRLYYPPVAKPKLAAAAEPSSTDNATEAVKKVAKLIPAEVITGYTALVAAIPAIGFAWLRPWLFGISFFLGWAATPLYLNKMAEAGKPKRNFLIVSFLSFPFWAYYTSGRQILSHGYDAGLAGVLLILFSIVSGLIPMSR